MMLKYSKTIRLEDNWERKDLRSCDNECYANVVLQTTYFGRLVKTMFFLRCSIHAYITASKDSWVWFCRRLLQIPGTFRVSNVRI